MCNRFHFIFLAFFISIISVSKIQGNFNDYIQSEESSHSNYVIKIYEPGFEDEHEKIALADAKDWAWPFLSFTDIYTQSDFDPETALSCFKGDKMVGFVLVKIMGEGTAILKNEGMGVYLDIPRVLPGYEEAADLLMKRIIEVLKTKGAKFIRTRVSTMRKNSIQLAEKWNFQPHKDFPLGYKIYYTYDLRKEKLPYSTDDIEAFNRQRDLDECVERVSYYFKMPKNRVKEWLLEVDSREDLVSHIVIRKNGKLEGYCFALPHHFNRDIMATIYMDASNESYLTQLIAQTIADGIKKGHKLFLVDIIGHLLKYKETVASCGFENAATWGVYELKLNSSSESKGHRNDWPVLRDPYFGQHVSSEKAEIFMDGIISLSNEEEMCAAFTADGQEFYYNAHHQDNWAIFMTKEVDGQWTRPTPLPFTSDYTDRDFTMSPDGNKILFGSNRPPSEGASQSESLDIFVTERLSGDRWSIPTSIGYPINTDRGENYPSVAQNGNLYFFSNRENGFGGCDIYLSRLVDGRYQAPENLGAEINSDKHDWDAYIAPDESYIIFSSQNRIDSIGKQDLYISFRTEKGGWTVAKNMGPAVNSPYDEICPSLSLDGKYLFFTSRRRGKADIFWIDARIIDDLRPKDSTFQ